MKIDIFHLVEGAGKATGLTVIIDVFRAFSLACYAFHNGCSKIIPVGTVEEALKYKEEHPDYILIGEVHERKPDGFDFGNSPTHIEQIDFKDKILVHRTSAGTQGIIHATKADQIITGSFVNAAAIVRYIQVQKPEQVSLVCMGYSALEPADEDTLCAELIKARLLNQAVDFTDIVEKLRNGSGKRLLDPRNAGHSPARDFELCTSLDRFDFILAAEKNPGLIFLHKINMASYDY